MHPLIEQHRAAIVKLARKRGAYNVRVFGSMARTGAGPDSDVDFVVDVEQGVSGFALGGLLMDLQGLLGRNVDLVTENALHPEDQGTGIKRGNFPVTPSERDDVYLEHMLECIARIEQYTRLDRQAFFRSMLVQDAVIRNLQTLAESSRRLSEASKAGQPQISWRDIAGFRNMAVHDYLGIDLDVIWAIVENELPALRQQALVEMQKEPDA